MAKKKQLKWDTERLEFTPGQIHAELQSICFDMGEVLGPWTGISPNTSIIGVLDLAASLDHYRKRLEPFVKVAKKKHAKYHKR